MNHYKSYMDRVAVSQEFHNRLRNLTAPKQSRVPWAGYAAVAACAALLIGVGAFALRHTESGQDPGPVPCAAPSAPVESQEAIDLAPVDPDEVLEPGMKTMEGYEVHVNRAGMDLVEYHILPWIDYGTENNAAALDWDIPQGSTRRDLTGDEITALLGGGDAVDLHLDWSAYELTGWAAWYADGSFWGAWLQGYKGPMDHFEFAVTAGQLPPSCIVFGGSVEQEIWGVTVTADKYDGEDGCSRRVSFMKDNYGYRFDLTATGGTEAAEKLVSRAVTHVAAGDGLDLYTLTGEEPTAPTGSPADSAASVPPQEAAAASVSGDAGTE